MESVLKLITTLFGAGGGCYLGYLILKGYTIHKVCEHPELSEQKVKAITSMVAKDKHQKI